MRQLEHQPTRQTIQRVDTPHRRITAESEADGKLVTKVDSVFVNPTDYSPLK